MKKTFFYQKSKPSFLPKIESRRFRGTSNRGASSYKSDAPEADGEAAELLAKIKSTVSQELATRATKEELKNIQDQVALLKDLPIAELRSMADAEKGVMTVLTAQGLELQRLKAQIGEQKTEDLSTRGQIVAWMERNKEAINAIRSGTKANLAPLDIQLATRAVANPMLPSTVMPNGSMHITRFEIERPVNQPLMPIPTFWDYIRKGTTNAETYIWVNRLPREGEAAFIAPGVYKPNISFTMDTDISNAKKVAASEKMALELLQDIDGFVTWVEDELRNAVLMKVNEKLTTGVASSTTPAGIRTLSVAFQGPSLGLRVTNPNYWDAIKAGVTMLKAQQRFQGRQVTVFVNPVDKANADMTKAQEQGQLFVPFSINATIVEDSSIPVGYVQFAVLDAYRVLVYKPFSMSWGWENDDFTKNLVTVIGEMRLHQFVKTSDDGAFVYDTFANIIDGIEEPQD